MTLVVLKPARPRRPAPIPSTGPIGGLSDPRFRYVPHLQTDIRKTFKRVRAQMARGESL